MVDYTASRFGNIVNFLLNDFNRVYCNFTDINGNSVAVNTVSGTPTTPTLCVYDESKDPSDLTRTVVSGVITQVAPLVTPGLYGYTLNPRDMDAGYYELIFQGELQSVVPYVTLVVKGAVRVSEATFEQDLMYRVRIKLKDVNTKLYQLDLPIEIWSDEDILYALQEALGQINVTPPMRTNYTYSDVYGYQCGLDSLVVRAAFGYLLESKAVLEAANTLTRSDGAATLTIQRQNLYASLASSVLNDANRKIEMWKKSLVPSLLGQGTMQYPYQLRRAVSFLPGFKNIFG